jgi:STAS domain
MITHASLKPDLDCELIAFYGELDAAAAPDLQARLAAVVEPPAGRLLIDLCGCSFIDSLGIATIVEGARAMVDSGRPAHARADRRRRRGRGLLEPGGGGQRADALRSRRLAPELRVDLVDQAVDLGLRGRDRLL